MARRSQSSSQGDNPLDPNYLPPHYKEYYRIAIDVLTEDGPDGYERFLVDENAPDFLCPSEVEHITKYLQRPPEVIQESPYSEPVYSTQEDADGSSGTYWPMHSDTAAPELDLGWPTIFGFQGTEVTTLIHPPPPDNPSIKEEARKMIRSAQQVIAIVMDIFTDVDILSDLLDAAARRIPVYIILDEMNSQHFLDMAAKCRINLNYVEFLRVRTVSGPTYYCRMGSTFRGHLQEKFLLVDCNVVLSGTYSYMWSFEKIHRSIAHIFQGELVSSFDEEFRILFAQSDPLIPSENVLAKMEKPFMGMVPYGGPRPLFERKLNFMYPRDDNSQNSQNFPNFMVDPDRHYLQSFRREEMMRHTMDNSGLRMYGKKFAEHMEMDKMQMSFMQNKNMDVEAYKRHSFAEGTFENYTAANQYSRQMFTSNNNDEYRFQSSQFQKSQFMQLDRSFTPTRTQGLFEKIRGNRQGMLEADENDSRFQNRALPGENNFALEGPPHTRLGYNPSNSSREVRHGSDQVEIGGEGRFGQRSQGRQKFMCQISPTHKQGMEQRHFFQDQDADKKTQENKEGLRSWRISSYLSGIQSDQDEEGLPVAIDSEAFDDALVPFEKAVPTSETLLKYSIDPIPPYKPPAVLKDVPMQVEKVKETLMLEKEKEDTLLARHDSFRTRTNPLLQRGSRLRSSLIFSSSKVEQHSSTASEMVQVVQKEQSSTEVIKENESYKTSSKVAEILEKYKTANKDSESATVIQAKSLAATNTIHEESEMGQKRSIETVAYKSLESKLLEKDSFSRTVLESQYRSSVNTKFQELFSKDNQTSTVTKIEQMASSIQTIESSKPALPEKNESQLTITEIIEEPKPAAIEAPKPPTPQESGLHFGNALEKMSQNPMPSSTMNKSDEEISRSEQNPMEFIRRGSMKLKQFLQSKAEKKAEEDLSSDIAKMEKQNTALRRLSKTESQESVTVVDGEEKASKSILTTSPKSSTAPQSRLSTSTSNVIFSSNLRDDTKVILEQISANSQKNRAEMAKQAQQPLSTSDGDASSVSSTTSEVKVEQVSSPESTSIVRTGSFLSRFSRPSSSSPEERDNLLKRMESIRKEKRVYSRFEVFCKKDEQQSQVEENDDADSKDKKVGKFMPRLLGNLIKK
ncbi:protein FAM83H [Bombina bombina]|uniref:protein FAM83H n=1 Tax=Bombina bombina TaxID=8345 RepID=UPI00235B1A5C|nr:protein FAM83H [Bombina bombina]XP_053571463.1 protein FAM83H [Bombina bombina]XP_053571464.1 protein FAM83H [Bombina bombina]